MPSTCPVSVRDAFPSKFQAFKLKMEAYSLPGEVVDIFEHYYSMLMCGKTGDLPEEEIDPVSDHDVSRYEELGEYAEDGMRAMSHAVIIKLNGGLGTSMGLAKAKSLIDVKDGLSFLDIILRQVERLREKYDTLLPLVLMNSFNTHVDCMLRMQGFSNGSTAIPLAFVQNRFPKVLQEDFSPASYPQNPELEWNPPGHGDLYTALVTSGMLKALLRKGVYYAFISNSDNLGAVMDEKILGLMARNKLQFVMEVAERTVSDRKGGHLARLKKNEHLVLREVAQCPDDDLGAFRDISRHRFFNTNSLWVDLRALDEIFLTRHMMPLDLIVNPKTLNPRDGDSPPVFQVETAMGSAISAFEHAKAVHVPRTRFAPVKTTNDLLLVMSDCYVLTDEETVDSNPRRKPPMPDVNLDSNYYKKIDDFAARFPHGAPSLIDCDEFSVEGDVAFGKNVIIRDNVSIKNTSSSQGRIRDNSELRGAVTL